MTEEVKGTEAPNLAASVEVVGDTMGMLIESGGVEKAFGKPIKKEDTTIIPTAEVITVLGFGSGFGAGSAPGDKTSGGGGGGGGGGGKTFSRPVAIVIASKDGVRVEPVVDVTKVALAAITAFGFMIGTLRKMKSGE